MKENVLNKSNILCILKCMNVKYIYIVVIYVELLFNLIIVVGGKVIKKVNCLMLFNELFRVYFIIFKIIE